MPKLNVSYVYGTKVVLFTGLSNIKSYSSVNTKTNRYDARGIEHRSDIEQFPAKNDRHRAANDTVIWREC